MHDFAAYRRNMVECQIRTNQVTDRGVLEAFANTPRERFVPASLAGCAYVDEAIPLGNDRYLVEPMVSARLMQALDLKTTDKVLLVGASTGYMAAILASIVGEVVALEVDADLAAQATRNLQALAVGNATVVTGSLPAGHARKAPYDAILIDGAVAKISAALGEQLRDGGRLAAVVAGVGGTAGQGTIVLKSHGTLSHRPLFDAATPLLPGFAPEPAFVF